MISKKQIEKFVEHLPKTNRELVIDYIKGKVPDTLEPSIVQNDCNLLKIKLEEEVTNFFNEFKNN